MKIETCNIADLPAAKGSVSQSIDWYHPGESRTVDIGGQQVTVRFVERKGRRGRIAIFAPPAAAFGPRAANQAQHPR